MATEYGFLNGLYSSQAHLPKLLTAPVWNPSSAMYSERPSARDGTLPSLGFLICPRGMILCLSGAAEVKVKCAVRAKYVRNFSFCITITILPQVCGLFIKIKKERSY